MSARATIALCFFLSAATAGAVAPVFDPAGASFYDLPFPHELRRDVDGTVSIARFFLPSNPLLDAYRAGIEEASGFGVASGVFFKLDGDIDPTTLPVDREASRAAGSSAFVIDIDPKSPGRGTRIALWTDFRSAGDTYRDPHLLTLMPFPGQVLDAGTLYAAVVTDDVHDTTAAPLTTPPAMQRLKDGTPQGAFETASQPLYDLLWEQLEQHESLPRSRVVVATVFRTGTPAAALGDIARFLRHHYAAAPTDLVYDPTLSKPNYFVVRGHVVSPQFQNGTPPFTLTTGEFVFDAHGNAVVQRDETLEFVLAVPTSAPMPRRGWPIALYMHGTGGSRKSFLNDGTAGRLADQGIASLSFDQPLHGLRPGGSDNFYNPALPLAFRDNTRQAAVDGLVLARLLGLVRFDPATLGIPASAAPSLVKVDHRRELFFGHSQGATVGPLVLAFAPELRGGVLSAGGGGLLLNIMTVDNPSIGGLTNRQLAELLLGTPLDVFNPVLHLIQMGGEPADAFAYVDRLRRHRRGRPLDLLFTHGMLDPEVTTPLNASMVVAAGYPLVDPTFPNRLFPAIPDYDYHESFALAGLPTLMPPVSGDIPYRHRPATGGMILFENEDHFPVFHNAQAIAQWTGFMHSLAYDKIGTIPARP